MLLAAEGLYTPTLERIASNCGLNGISPLLKHLKIFVRNDEPTKELDSTPQRPSSTPTATTTPPNMDSSEFCTFSYKNKCANINCDGVMLTSTKFSQENEKLGDGSGVSAHCHTDACREFHAHVKGIWWGLVNQRPEPVKANQVPLCPLTRPLPI